MSYAYTYTKLPPDTKIKWLAALRNPAAKQTQGVLENFEGENCCLGVLARVMGVETAESNGETKRFLFSQTETNIAQIPESICTSWELDRAAADMLINLNDKVRLSFSEIADWIEVNL